MDEENSTNLGLDSANSIFDEEMVNLEDLDLDIELGSLSLNDENEWDAANILDNIGTPLFNSLMHPTLHQSDLTIEKQQQQDLRSSISGNPETHENEAIAIGHNLKGSSSIIVATRNKNQNTTEPASIEQQSVTATLGHDPSPLFQSSSNSSSPPLHPSLPKVGIILEREGSLTHQDQEYISRMSWFNQFPHHMQHENSHRNEGGDMDYQHSNSPLVPNTMSNYNLQVEVRAGNGTTYHSSGQFIRNQRSVFQNNIMDTHTAFNSGSVSLPQDGFAPLPTPAPEGMYYNKIYDLNSQNSLRLTPDYPFYPRGQAKPHPSLIQVPPTNHAYNRPIPSNSTALPYYRSPPMYSTYHSHHPQPAPYPHPYATTTYHNNSFGLGSSVQPSMCPPPYGNIYNPQTMILQQFSRSQDVASSNHQMNGYNKYNGLLMNTNTPPPPPERQSYNTMMLPQEALPSSTAAMSWSQQHNIINDSQSQSQALMRSMSAELFSGNTQGSSSQDSNSRGDSDDFARLLRLIRPESALGNHQEQRVTTPVSIINNVNNQVLTRQQRGKGKLPQSSTTREPSAAIRRILDMSSTRTVIRNPLPNQTPLAIQTSNYPAYESRGGWIPDLKKQVMSNSSTNSVLIRLEKEKRRRGRPRKIQPQLQPHSASSSNLGKRGRPSRSPEVDQPPYKQPSSHSTC
ncbi:hypothetical protein AAHE18_17G218500 [Arachis hypogaea]|nr:uncharacterized protein LOC112767333 isoform X3 [Arachis hypogaea]